MSKKGKKSKGKVVSLQDFLATSTSAGTAQVPVKIRSWADECEEDDEPVRTQIINLPTAPRASRILNDDSIPTSPPFTAHLSNLPYEINEDEIEEFFAEENIMVKQLHLPREDSDTGRLKGFGNVEFENRQDLIDAISIPNPTIRNRRIRINVSSEHDGKQGGRNRNYDNYGKGGGADNDNTNWRDRGRDGDFDANEPRENRRNYNRDYNRDRGNRTRDREGGSDDKVEDVNWRLGERPNITDSPPPERKQFSGGNRNERRGGRFNDRFERRSGEDMPRERPKIVLQPRTLPLPELHFPAEEELDGKMKKSLELNADQDNKENHNGEAEKEKVEEERPKPKPVPAESIFGKAKPVDTAAREREIELRRENERLKRLEEEEKERLRKEAEEPESPEPHEPQVEEQEEVIESVPRETEEKSGGEEKKSDDVGSWRKRTDNEPPLQDDLDRRDRRPYSPNRENRDRRPMARRNDGDREGRPYKENRNRDYNRGNEFGRGGMGNRGGERKNERRDERPIKRAERPPRMERDRDPKEIEERMPKLKPTSGPNLSIKNAFEGLKSEDEAD